MEAMPLKKDVPPEVRSVLQTQGLKKVPWRLLGVQKTSGGEEDEEACREVKREMLAARVAKQRRDKEVRERREAKRMQAEAAERCAAETQRREAMAEQVRLKEARRREQVRLRS